MRPNRTPIMCTSLNVYTHSTWGFFYRSLLLFSEHQAQHICVLFHICTFSSPLYASLWLKFLPTRVAWLVCLCPTFPFVRLNRTPMTYTSLNVYAHNTWGFFYRSLLLFSEHQAHHICVLSSYVPFLRHYMHRYDLSFGQAGLLGSCVYALRSR